MHAEGMSQPVSLRRYSVVVITWDSDKGVHISNDICSDTVGYVLPDYLPKTQVRVLVVPEVWFCLCFAMSPGHPH